MFRLSISTFLTELKVGSGTIGNLDILKDARRESIEICLAEILLASMACQLLTSKIFKCSKQDPKTKIKTQYFFRPHPTSPYFASVRSSFLPMRVHPFVGRVLCMFVRCSVLGGSDDGGCADGVAGVDVHADEYDDGGAYDYAADGGGVRVCVCWW